MSNNPYAKKFGASSREQKRQSDADLYSFDPSAAANELIAATIGAGGGAGNAFGYDGFMPAPGGAGGMLASQRAQQPPGTQSGGGGPMGGGFDGPRPMTSAKGAGYSSAPKSKTGGGVFDPLGQSSTHGPAPPLATRGQESPEHAARTMERSVNSLLEQSAFSAAARNHPSALAQAKEAGKLERALCKHREKHSLTDALNLDLTYAVCLNLASCYAASKMYSEALAAYALVVRNKSAYPAAQGGRLRVNMGNIYYAQKKYPAAIKMYRMAMDAIGSVGSRVARFRIMRNIASAFIRLGQYADAIHSLEAIMDAHPDAQTGFNLVVAYYAVGDREKMRKAFAALINVPEFKQQEKEDEQEQEEEAQQQAEADAQAHQESQQARHGHAAKQQTAAQQKAKAKSAAPSSLVVDELKAERKARRKVTHRYLHMAARLIAPVLERDLASGFDWVIEQLKAPRGGGVNDSMSGGMGLGIGGGGSSSSGFPGIAMELEIAKGLTYLKRRSIREAIEVFKGFEKNDVAASVLDQAATNLAFLYFLEGDLASSTRYADLAVRSDRYNARALVNKANNLFVRSGPGDLDAAKELYLEAIGVEADCVEAIYNLGLANKKLGQLGDAAQAFKKLHRISPKDTQVVWHLANLCEIAGDHSEAAQLFTTLHGMVPSDPKVLARLGTLYTKEDDETAAFHNFHDSFAAYPVSMEVISWLGVWYVKSGLYEDACGYFSRAGEIEPHEVKWQLMVASCYRRMQDYTRALALYKKIHKQEPENIECLRYLCTISKDTADPREFEEYSKLLKKAERAQQQKEQQQQQQQGGYMRGDVSAANDYQQHHPDDELEHDGSRAPDVSPGATARHLARAPVNHADAYRPELSPQKQGPTFQVGQGGNDEWGDGLGDELLP